MTRREMVRFNATEGLPGWRYRPIWLKTVDAEGRSLWAFSLIADGLADDGNPSLRYIALIRDGARQHNLPSNWIEKLDRIRAEEEKD